MHSITHALSDWASNLPTQFLSIDMHTGGEPLRVVLGAVPEIPGETILDKRRYLQNNHDLIRRRLMAEPRGHADMYGCYLTEPVTADGHFGVIFLHNEGYSTMCGHAVIALTSLMRRSGLWQASELRIDSPAGRVVSTIDSSGTVTFENVTSFKHSEISINIAGRAIEATIAFGGAFYAYLDADRYGWSLEPSNAANLIKTGNAIMAAAQEVAELDHPDSDMNFIYGAIFSGKPKSTATDLRNVCVFADGQIDRSPTGTGVSGRMAIEVAEGRKSVGESMRIESIVDSVFTVHAAREASFAGNAGIVPSVSGRAHITGINRFFFDADDDVADGFLVR